MLKSYGLFSCYLLLLYLALNWAMGVWRMSFPGQKSRAKQVLDQLRELIAHHKQLQIEGGMRQWSFPRYKFYTALLETLLRYSVQFGAPITEHLKSLRRCLVADWEFEQKLAAHLFSTAGQMLVIALVTWCFGFFCQGLLAVWPAAEDLWLVGGLQVLGSLGFCWLYRRRKERLFGPYEKCYHALLSAAILQQLGISLHQVVARCGLEQLPKVGPLASFRTQLQELFRDCHHRGHSLQDFLEELRAELDFSLAEDFKRFLRFTAGIKFLTLALCYLPAYLIFVLSLFDSLWEGAS